jgi:hypothetical protein
VKIRAAIHGRHLWRAIDKTTALDSAKNRIQGGGTAGKGSANPKGRCYREKTKKSRLRVFWWVDFL